VRVTPQEASILAYTTIVVTALAGAFHAPWWAVMAGGCILTLISITDDHKYQIPEDDRSGYGAMVTLATGGSFLIGCTAATAAFLLGRLSGLVWGL